MGWGECEDGRRRRTEQFVSVCPFLSSSSVDLALAFCLGSPLFQPSSNCLSMVYLIFIVAFSILAAGGVSCILTTRSY